MPCMSTCRARPSMTSRSQSSIPVWPLLISRMPGSSRLSAEAHRLASVTYSAAVRRRCIWWPRPQYLTPNGWACPSACRRRAQWLSPLPLQYSTQASASSRVPVSMLTPSTGSTAAAAHQLRNSPVPKRPGSSAPGAAPSGQRTLVTPRSRTAASTSARKPPADPSSTTPPSTQRPRCSVTLPKIRRSTVPMGRPVSTSIWATGAPSRLSAATLQTRAKRVRALIESLEHAERGGRAELDRQHVSVRAWGSWDSWGQVRAGGQVRRALGPDEGQHPARAGGRGGDLGRAQRQARALARTAAAEPVDPDRLARGQRGQRDQQPRVDLARGQRGPRGRRDHDPRGVQQLVARSEEHTSELQSRRDLVCRLLLETKNKTAIEDTPSLNETKNHYQTNKTHNQ